ncbi:MAG: hypothetical protein LUE14_07900 [Clostridiales bacterium]|nr:hypothetical protein [Clostridiales bacterium]
MARILLSGAYKSPTEYILKEEGGRVYMTLRAGEVFRIGKDNPWRVEQVARENGYGTILFCRMYGSDGKIAAQKPLPHGKKLLWATTSGSARNGLWHYYHEPKDSVEQICGSMGIPWDRREKVPYIDEMIDIWDDGWGTPSCVLTDGTIQFGVMDDWTGFFMPDREHGSGFARLVPEADENTARVFNASFCIRFYLKKDRAFGRERLSVEEVLYTDGGIGRCTRELTKLYEKYYRLPAEGGLAS